MIVDINNLVKRYGDLIALDHFDLHVEEGEVFGLLGPNGSGKTTAINCMLALLTYSKGDVALFGRPMKPDAYALKRDIGLVMQNVAVFDELTVRDNIDYFCGLYVNDRKRRQELVDEAIAFVGLEDYTRFLPKKLSGGLLRRLNIACGIAHKPKLIILDEPTVAVDPQSRNRILEGIQALNRQGATIIYTSHYMEEVEQICTRIAIMDKGKVIAQGTAEELKDMIRAGEKITVELPGLPSAATGMAPAAAVSGGAPAAGPVRLAEQIAALPHIVSAAYDDDGRLVIQSERRQHNLTHVLDFLHANNVIYGRVLCELPTLNDVFLEITGKQLRD